jgi:hypothetical protein
MPLTGLARLAQSDRLSAGSAADDDAIGRLPTFAATTERFNSMRDDPGGHG